MRISQFSRYLIVLVTFVLLWSCEEVVDPPGDVEVDLHPDLGLNLEDSLEAEMVAYYLDQTLMAADSTLEQELYLLNHLRETFRDSFPVIDALRFMPPWEMNAFMVGAEASVLQQIGNGSFQNWGSIHTGMRPDSIYDYSSMGLIVVYIPHGYHPVLLADLYEELPDVHYAEENSFGWVDGPYYSLAINRTATGNQYLFTEFSAPATRTYHFFEYIDTEPVHIQSSIHPSMSSAYGGFMEVFRLVGYP